MSYDKLSEEKFIELLKTSIDFKHQLMSIALGLNLTLMQAITLIFLKDPMTTRQISFLYQCDDSNISGIVEGLYEKKMIFKEEDQNDRRIKYIGLNETGIKIRTKLIDSYISNLSKY